MIPIEQMRKPAERVRIAVIHALDESVLPARRAFAEAWPQAVCCDLLDASLSADLAFRGSLDQAISDRIRFLAEYMAATEGDGGKTAGILFTCSAFGLAIETVKSFSQFQSSSQMKQRAKPLSITVAELA
ncbi:hypothetical protein BH10PSE7_BH10PSE7_04930 [soil metagenome]